MTYKIIFFNMFMLFANLILTDNYEIKAVCIDIEALFVTNDMRASNYVGKINALQYLKKMGHLPCQADLFKQLSSIPAQSTQVTYNNDLTMPLILSDWLLNAQPSATLINVVNTYLKKSKLSTIEKVVHENVTNMMLTPKSLVDTQQVVPTTLNLVSALRKNKYQVYLVGNWSNRAALQQAFPQVFQQFTGVFISGDIHELKPHQEFYASVLEKTGFKSHEVVWIEKESKFITFAKQDELLVAKFYNNNPKALSDQLKKFNINVA